MHRTLPVRRERAHPRRPRAVAPWLLAAGLLMAGGAAMADTTLPVAAVSASGHDGNLPANAVDGNLGTRWSSLGKGQWLQADLGAPHALGALEIAWYRGDTRTNRFELSVSDDGRSFRTVSSGSSSGKTSAFERIVLPPSSGRYLRVTVNGNTSNDWASISELRVLAAGAPPADGGKDGFGITKLYPGKPGGQAWALGDDPLHDARFDPQDKLTRNADGSWKIKSSKVRMGVFTSSGYDAHRIATYRRDVLAAQGFMQDANDWKNVEMTGYVRLNATSDGSDNFDWYARGGRHNDDQPCEGSSYKGGLHYDGRVRWQKETWHVSYEQAPYKPATSALRGRWVGFKAVMRNTQESGRPAVKLELWLNDNADKVTWKKVDDWSDAGQWGGDASVCGGSSDAMPITWGGPIATFRWDNATDVDFKWLSVREIAE